MRSKTLLCRGKRASVTKFIFDKMFTLFLRFFRLMPIIFVSFWYEQLIIKEYPSLLLCSKLKQIIDIYSPLFLSILDKPPPQNFEGLTLPKE
jgi:hypothetical protein